MAFFRKIVVDGERYEWKFSFDNYDWQEASHLVYRNDDKTLKIILRFHSEAGTYEIGKCPFNNGLTAVKHGQPVIINLNQPCFVAEILQYLLAYRVQPGTKGSLQFEDGTGILHELGYQFEYRLRY